MSKFSSNEKLNRSIERARVRSDLVQKFIEAKLVALENEYNAKFGDSSGKYAYMTGYLTSILADVAKAETIAEMRRVFEYSGVKL
jgi:hypothetical protein